jgi:MFS family permease
MYIVIYKGNGDGHMPCNSPDDWRHLCVIVAELVLSQLLLKTVADIPDRYGRKSAVMVPYFIAACFSFGTATAKDIQTILTTRFFTGLFGAAPVTNTGGVLGDIWAPSQRGNALVGYAFAVVAGPTLGCVYVLDLISVNY